VGGKAQTEHGRSANDRSVAGVERVDPGHGRGADVVGQLVALAGRRGGQQVEQEFGASPRARDGQLDDVRR